MFRLPIILIFYFFFCTSSDGLDDEALIAEQKNMVAELSGHKPLSDGTVIENRSSKRNRTSTRKHLSNLIKKIGLEPKEQEYRMPNVNPIVDLLFNPFEGANIYTILPATTNSKEFVILGGHLDTERNCPGATDNATGITLAYSVVKKLSELNERNINIILVFFDQEEDGLIGSQTFAKYCKKEGFNIHSVHTFDTIGWDSDNDKAVEIELPSKSLEKIYRSHAEKLGIPIYTTQVNSTDHHSFRELGFNAIGLTDEYVNGDYPPHKDTPEDTFEKVNFNFLASTTTLVYETVKDIISN